MLSWLWPSLWLSWLLVSLWSSLWWSSSLLNLWLQCLIRLLVVICCCHKIYDSAHLFSIESSILHHIGHTFYVRVLGSLLIFALFFRSFLLWISGLRLSYSVGFLIFFVLCLLCLHLVVVFLYSDHLVNLFLRFFLFDLNDLLDLFLLFLDNLLDSLDGFFANLHFLGIVSVLDHEYLLDLVFSLHFGRRTHIDQVFNLVGLAHLLRGCNGVLMRLCWRIYLERLASVFTVMDNFRSRLPRYDISLCLLSGHNMATTMAVMLDSVSVFAWSLRYHFFLDSFAVLNLGRLGNVVMLVMWTMLYCCVERFRSIVTMFSDSCLFCTGYYNETVIEFIKRL